MPRKRNQKTIESVLDASWELFCQKGYAEVSYTDIAGASGVNRATVQHYFPRKELMASTNLERLRAACGEVARELWPGVDDALARQYLVGQIYVSALLADEGVRRFTAGVLESRAFTEATIGTDLDWSIEQVLGRSGAEADAELRHDVIAGMNGLYGLMYHSALTGEGFDVAKRLRSGLASLGRLAGRPAGECARLFDRHALGCDELRDLGRQAGERAFGGR